MQIYSPIITGSLDITGSVAITGSLKVSSGITGSLFGTASYASTVAGFGPGINNYIPRWSGTSAIVNSAIYNNGSLVGINTASPGYVLDVNGTIRSNTYLYVGGGGNSEYAIEIGQSRTGNGNAYLDLIGDATYTDYGLRIIRGATGANTTSNITHRGTGIFTIETLELGSISFNTNNSRRLLIDGTGSIVITGSALKIDIPSRANGYVLTSDASGNATWQLGAASFPYSGSAVISGSLVLTGSLSMLGSSLKIDIPSKVNGYVLTSDSDGNATWQAVGASTSFPYSGSAVITGSLTISGSGLTITGSINSTTGFTGSLFGTSSYAITASYALNGGAGGTIASISQINTGAGSGVVTPENQEQSKYTTINIFNFLNFN